MLSLKTHSPKQPSSFIVMLRAIVLLFSVSAVLSACPYQHEIPRHVNTYDLFVCAKVYVDPFCQGTRGYVYNGERVNLGWESPFHDTISAVVTRPGCTFVGHQHGSFRGWITTLSGVYPNFNLLPFGIFGGTWNNRISSLKCDCEYTNDAATCQPFEAYVHLKSCRSSHGGDMECTYTTTKGTSYGQSLVKSKSVSLSAAAEMEIAYAFLAKFRSLLSSSVTTKFMWQTTTVEQYSRATEYRVSCSVPPGKTVTIRQAVGRCGDTTVYSPYFECI